MRKLVVRVVAVAGLKVQEGIFCEVEFKNQKHKTKVLKGNLFYDQQFNIGQYESNDTILCRCVGKRSKTVHGETTIQLGDIKDAGRHDKEIYLETCILKIELIIEENILRRTSSITRISRRLSRFLSQTNLDDMKEKFEDLNPELTDESQSTPDLNSIKHSQSHTENLSENNTENPESSLKRNLSDEALDEKLKNRRDRRRKTGTGKHEKKDSKTESENQAQTESTPRRKASKKSSTQRVKESPRESSSPRSAREDRKHKSKKDKPIENIVVDIVENVTETTSPPATPVEQPQPTSDAPDGTNHESVSKLVRNTVVLQPIGGTTQKLFGVSLEEVMTRQKENFPTLNLEIPLFFHISAQIIRSKVIGETKGCTAKGIFRIRGKLGDVKKLKAQIDAGEELKEDSFDNIHLIPTIMKAFLRELPTPILTYANYDNFMACFGCEENEQIDRLSKLVTGLPEHNYQLLKYLFALLYDLSLLADETQMNAENLAKVISPNLIWKEELDINDLSLVDDTLKGNTIVSIMITQNQRIFCR